MLGWDSVSWDDSVKKEKNQTTQINKKTQKINTKKPHPQKKSRKQMKEP